MPEQVGQAEMTKSHLLTMSCKRISFLSLETFGVVLCCARHVKKSVVYYFFSFFRVLSVDRTRAKNGSPLHDEEKRSPPGSKISNCEH